MVVMAVARSSSGNDMGFLMEKLGNGRVKEFQRFENLQTHIKKPLYSKRAAFMSISRFRSEGTSTFVDLEPRCPYRASPTSPEVLVSEFLDLISRYVLK